MISAYEYIRLYGIEQESDYPYTATVSEINRGGSSTTKS